MSKKKKASAKRHFEENLLSLENCFYDMARGIHREIVKLEDKMRMNYLELLSGLFDDERIESGKYILLNGERDKLSLNNLTKVLTEYGYTFDRREYERQLPVTIVSVKGLMEVHYQGNHVWFVAPEDFRFSELEFYC